MQEITIYNKNGEPLTELAQWDKNIQIQICEKDIDDAYNVHFINCNSKEAMVVKSTYQDGTLCTVVPNDILTEPHPITGYVWAGNDTKTDEEHKSTYCFRIMVRKRPKPANYVYSDQKEYITFETVLEEASAHATAAESFTHGRTESREGEDNDNAEYYCTQSQESASTAQKSMNSANESASYAQEQALRAESSANAVATLSAAAENNAASAEKSATEAESFAHGLSGARENENTDNAMYYYEQAKNNGNISKEYLTKVEKAGADAIGAIKSALDIDAPSFSVDLSTGHLTYEGGRFMFQVNKTGHLEWGLTV